MDLAGPGGLLGRLTKTVIETSLNEEMTKHLGYKKNVRAGSGGVSLAAVPSVTSTGSLMG